MESEKKEPGNPGLGVLVAEDNPINQDIARLILESLGLKVSVVADGAAAVAATRAERFDLILMDLQMPGVDGFEATRAIRAQEGGAGVPIFAMTAHDATEIVARCAEAGMNGHVAKPLEADALAALLPRCVPAGGRMSPETAPESFWAPGALPGIDVTMALERFLRDPSWLRQVLEKFYRAHGDDPERIREFVLRGDPESAQRLTHSLKGAAGHICANDLYETCCRLDDALEAGRAVEGLLEPFEAAFAIVINGLRPLTEANGAARSVEDQSGAAGPSD